MKKRTLYVILSLSLLAWLLTACTPRQQTGRGFVFPGGDADRGRLAFVELGCYNCHAVSGVSFPAPSQAPERLVILGGEVSNLRSYGDLITSIIHPSQRISEKVAGQPLPDPKVSPMPVVNEVMTVQQMLDLAEFLQPQYRQLLQLYEGPML
jgi:predicted small secreted protein